MSNVRKFFTALTIAGVMATGLGTVAEAKDKKPRPPGGGQEAICTYLENALSLPYLSDFIRMYLQQLYIRYGCGQVGG